jgi:hypothetical protein
MNITVIKEPPVVRIKGYTIELYEEEAKFILNNCDEKNLAAPHQQGLYQSSTLRDLIGRLRTEYNKDHNNGTL